MRKVVVLTFVSLDGVMQAPGGPEEDTSGGFKYGGWVFPYFDDILGEEINKQMQQPFDLLLGRKTYDIFAAYWPFKIDDPVGIKFNQTKKYVASKTLTNLTWANSVLLKDNVAQAIKKLKQEEGPALHVYGSGNFVQTLLQEDLVDELWLKTFPLTLGKGKRLFAEGTQPAAFVLQDSMVSPKGVIVASYIRAGEVKAGSFE